MDYGVRGKTSPGPHTHRSLRKSTVAELFGPLAGKLIGVLNREDGQNTFEYLLVVGAVLVAVAVVISGGFQDILHQFIGVLCATVDPVGSTGPGQCLGG